jgi:hypothetical protein
MSGLLAGKHGPPVARAPRPGPVPMGPKQRAPKLNAVSVTHHYTAAPSKTFSFKKPTDLAAHIKKIQNGEWAHPDVNRSAAKIDADMDIG